MSFHLHDHSRDFPTDHALLSPSKGYWLNYDNDKMFDYICSSYAQKIGTLIHELAAKLITYKIKVSKNDARKMITLYLLENDVPRFVIDPEKYVNNFVAYVNDAIGFDMMAEVRLKYSDNIFGTMDAFRFNEKKMHLRIHDYKSGSTEVKMRQLLIYASVFCLEYNMKPKDLQMELRLYWQEEIIVNNPTVADIAPIIDKIIHDNNFINRLKGEEE